MYFKELKYMAVLTLIVSIFAAPSIVLYYISIISRMVGNPTYFNEITLYGINKKSFIKTTFGNMGRGGYACTNGILGTKVTLSCSFGTINSLVSFGLASKQSSCSSEA